jgi:hypothetical protein
MSHLSYGPANSFDRARTPAQWYCLLAGLSLVLAGLLGFFADADFDTGQGIDGGSLVGFEVNAIHNLIHLASGLLLVAAARTRQSARAIALAFGLVYGVVAIIGIVDGSDVLGLIPVNSADNVLHVGLAALGVLCALISRSADRRHSDTLIDHTTTGTNPRFEPAASGRERGRRYSRRVHGDA